MSMSQVIPTTRTRFPLECKAAHKRLDSGYVCGASVNPGGWVTFGPSYIPANTIAEEYKITQCWKEPEYITKARKMGYFGED